MTRSELIYNKLMCCIHNGEVENIELTKIVKDISIILGLKTLTSYSESEKISYPAAAKRKTDRVKIDKVEFIINNE